jgi:hypothetical protein
MFQQKSLHPFEHLSFRTAFFAVRNLLFQRMQRTFLGGRNVA